MSGNTNDITVLEKIQEAISDGPHWRPDIGEYEIILAGEAVSYASNLGRAWEVYRELATTHWNHARREHGRI